MQMVHFVRRENHGAVAVLDLRSGSRTEEDNTNCTLRWKDRLVETSWTEALDISSGISVIHHSGDERQQEQVG
jgi:hypothetical protein